MADGQRFDLRCQSDPRDRCGPQPRALLHATESPESSGMAEAFVKTFKRDVSVSIRFRTPKPRSRQSITGWKITSLNTRIPGRASAHRDNTLHHFQQAACPV